MSFRRKRKVSAPGRLISPFVVGQTDKHGSAPCLAVPVQTSFFSRRISSYALDKRNSEHATIAELPIDEDNVFVDKSDGQSNRKAEPPLPMVNGHPITINADEDEGYISPNNTGLPPLELPDNPGELTLVFLLSLFVEEAEKKIDKFAKSVSGSHRSGCVTEVLAEKRYIYHLRPVYYLY